MFQSRLALILAASATIATATASGQTYTVKADGTGDFDDLQVALDTVPDGSVILLHPTDPADPPWPPVRIGRAVTLLGITVQGAVPRIWTVADLSGYPQPPITVDAAGDVVLSNLDLDPFLYTVYLGGAETCIVDVVLADSLTIDRCALRGTSNQPEWWGDLGRFDLCHDGILVSGACGTLFVANSFVQASWGINSSSCGDDASMNDVVIARDGGQGIDATNAVLVVVTNSEVRGGNGGMARYAPTCFWNDDDPPSILEAGDGGNAIVGECHLSDCVLVAGLGGVAEDAGLGFGIDGADGVEVLGTRRDLPDLLGLSGWPAIGQTLTVDGAGYSPYRVALFFVSTSVADPVGLRNGWWFLEWPFFYAGYAVTDVAGRFSIDATLPDDATLIGIRIVTQVADTEHLSEPELVLVQGG